MQLLYPSYLKVPKTIQLFILIALLISLIALHTASFAQSLEDSSVVPRTIDNLTPQLGTVTVTANPLGSELLDMVAPSSVLEGQRLSLKRSQSLGATLSQLPGVSETQFGPNSSRPIIRGLDSDRIKLLQNGIGMLDASSLSFDHAVSADMLSADRIEVVRGPATLLYGGNAIGGVVNIIDNRIPSQPIYGSSASAELRYGGSEGERSSSLMGEFGNGKIALHIEAFNKKTSDLKIPGLACTSYAAECPAPSTEGKLVNSASESHGATIGAAITNQNSYFGLAYSDLTNVYGTVKEPNVNIKLDSNRLDLNGGWKTAGFIKDIKFKATTTDYAHAEFDTTTQEIGTRFLNKGYETRLDFVHDTLGNFKGSFGLHLSDSKFSALGEEAFVPNTQTKNHAFFIFEEANLNDKATINLGLRWETNQVSTAGADGNNDLIERFGEASEQKFHPLSSAIGGLVKLNPNWSVVGNYAINQRAPTFYELYANGPHFATGAYEIGNPNLNKEKSKAVDFSLRYKQSENQASIGLFIQDFSNFIAQLTDGSIQTIEGSPLPNYFFTPVKARFKGLEAQSKWWIAEGLWQKADRLLLEWKGDLVKADNLNSNQPMPRIAPFNMNTTLSYQLGKWETQAEWIYAAKQSRVPENESPSDAYQLINFSINYSFKQKIFDTFIYAKFDNVMNQQARLATSFLRDIAPLGGRSLKVGIKTLF